MSGSLAVRVSLGTGSVDWTWAPVSNGLMPVPFLISSKLQPMTPSWYDIVTVCLVVRPVFMDIPNRFWSNDSKMTLVHALNCMTHCILRRDVLAAPEPRTGPDAGWSTSACAWSLELMSSRQTTWDSNEWTSQKKDANASRKHLPSRQLRIFLQVT